MRDFARAEYERATREVAGIEVVRISGARAEASDRIIDGETGSRAARSSDGECEVGRPDIALVFDGIGRADRNR